jgi:hypothetical protein
MTEERSGITPETAEVLARRAGLAAGRGAELAPVLEIFRQRVERLHALEVGEVEFDFLRPMDRAPR